jgi:hypothetical protein
MWMTTTTTMKNRESAYTRETTRVTLLVVDEPHTRGRARFSLSLCLSLSLSLTLSRNFCYCLLMMMRERESNDDSPGGCGTQRNSTIKQGTRNRTDEHDKANERTTAFFSSISFFSPFLFLLFFLLPIAYEWSGGVGSKGRRVRACMYSGEDKRTNIDDIFCVLACILLLQQFPLMLF